MRRLCWLVGGSALALASVLTPTHRGAGQTASAQQSGAERVFSDAPNTWLYEEYPRAARISADGKWLVYVSAGRVRVIDLLRGREAPARVWPGIVDAQRAVFGPDDELQLLGTHAGKTGWFGRGRRGLTLLPLPSDASPQWSPDGKFVAFSRASVADSVFAGPVGTPRSYPTPGAVTGFAWLPQGRSLAVLTVGADGGSLLSVLALAGGEQHVVAHDLDAPTFFAAPLSLSPDGGRAYLTLASPTYPDAEVRHRPHVARRLGVYEVDLRTGARREVIPPPSSGDYLAPTSAGGYLYWTHTASDIAVVTLPSNGGAASVVAHNAMGPSWRPDSRAVGFVDGELRWVDWALSLDGGVVEVDSLGKPLGTPIPIITGYHEDYEPVWSSHGTWIAFHSHRSTTPVPTYDATGSTDDIWLRRIGAPALDTAEIRLTDFGLEAGSPDWSRDGVRLVFTSFDRAHLDAPSAPYLVRVDTVTGSILGHERLRLPPQIKSVVSAAWSPASDEIALEVDLGGGRHQLWVVGGSGEHPNKVVEYSMPTIGGVSWTEDGKSIVYAAVAGERMQLFRVAVKRGNPEQLSRDSANLLQPRVAPNGRTIAATRVSHRKEVWRIPLPR